MCFLVFLSISFIHLNLLKHSDRIEELESQHKALYVNTKKMIANHAKEIEYALALCTMDIDNRLT